MRGQLDETRGNAQQELDQYLAAVRTVHSLPDGEAGDLAVVAARVGVDKLSLIGWARVHIDFARLLASKLTVTEGTASASDSACPGQLGSGTEDAER